MQLKLPEAAFRARVAPVAKNTPEIHARAALKISQKVW
jgi:hypothetical protein